RQGLKAGIARPAPPMGRFRPLSVEELKALGLTDEWGIDKHFVAQARKADKPVLELETLETQLKLFSDLSPQMQEKVLAKTFHELPKIKEQMDSTWAAWQAGDAHGIDEALLLPYRKDPDFRPLIEKFFDERNLAIAGQIEKFLKEREPCFVVVGAGHVVGDKGIIHLLEGKKYKVEQVRRAKAQKKAS